jgi:hypothetical protein
VLAALASPPATKALDPDPFPCRSLRHAVYAALLHFGLESAIQKDLRVGDLEILISNPRITHLGEQIETFEDTAAIISSLDRAQSPPELAIGSTGAIRIKRPKLPAALIHKMPASSALLTTALMNP